MSSKAIGMIELSSIARGIEVSDYMVKAAQVELLRASTVCPGKYVVIGGAVSRLSAGDVAVFDVVHRVLQVPGGEIVDDHLAAGPKLRRHPAGHLPQQGQGGFGEHGKPPFRPPSPAIS